MVKVSIINIKNVIDVYLNLFLKDKTGGFFG